MSNKYKVNFIACKYSQLAEQVVEKGNLIALRDRSEVYYDLPWGEGESTVRRKLSGIGCGSSLPEPQQIEGSNKLHGDPEYYIIFNSQSITNGLYVWNPDGGLQQLGEYELIAQLDSGRISTVQQTDTKLYLTGTRTGNADSDAQLLVGSIYIDEVSGKLVGDLDGTASSATHSDTSDSATNAENAENATKDDAGQTITNTYIKNVEVNGRDITLIKGDDTASIQTVAESRYYLPLDVSCDLDDIIDPGLYYASHDNLIINKPDDVNGFGLDVYTTDHFIDRYSSLGKRKSYICQELHASGCPWNSDTSIATNILGIKLYSDSVSSDGSIVFELDPASNIPDHEISSDTFDDTSTYAKYNFWDNVKFQYTEDSKTKVISLRNVLKRIQFTDHENAGNVIHIQTSSNNLEVSLPGVLLPMLDKVDVRPNTDFPDISREDDTMLDSTSLVPTKTCYNASDGCIVVDVDMDYPAQSILSQTLSTTINSDESKFKRSTNSLNCTLSWTHVSSGSPDKYYLVLGNLAVDPGSNNYKIKVNGKFTSDSSNVINFNYSKLIEFSKTSLTYNINTIEVYSHPSSDDTDLTLQGQCYILNSDSNLPQNGTSSVQDYIRKCVGGVWTAWEPEHGLDYTDIYIP